MAKKFKVIVTGGAGFIGSHLVDELVKLGHRVTVYDNLSSGYRKNLNPKARFIKAELSRPVKFVPADYVFHLAALPRIERSFDQPLKTHQANLTATLNVLKASAEIKAKRLVYASSSSVYGKINLRELPVKETHPTDPQSPYAAQKLMSEIYCRVLGQTFGLDTVILRLFNVFGPRQPTTGAYKLVIPIFLKQRQNNQPLTIYGDGRQTRDFTYISDVIRAFILAMLTKHRHAAEVINIGSGVPTSVNKIAQLIGGPKVYIKPNPRSRWEEKYKYADIVKARKLLGWEPRQRISVSLLSDLM